MITVRRTIASVALAGAALTGGLAAQAITASEAAAVTATPTGNGYYTVGVFKTMSACKTHRASAASVKRYNLGRTSCHQRAGGYVYVGRIGA